MSPRDGHDARPAARKSRRVWAACLIAAAALVAAPRAGSAFANTGLHATTTLLQSWHLSLALPGTRPREVARQAESQEAADARERFLRALKESEGDWRSDAVTAELGKLQEANPTADPAFTGDYLDADWLQVSSPDYNFGTQGSTEYTLGQLSFNMYEPKDMKMKIDKTTQLVKPIDGSNGTRSWDITLHLTAVDERYPAFKAKLTTFGVIKPGKDKQGKNNRLDVSFERGTLNPAPDTDKETLAKWLDVFGAALQGRKRTLGSVLMNGMLRLMMGLRLPAGIDKDGTMTFEMRKPPHGYTDILYIDDKLRVTRGNRGSIVAVTRTAP